MLGIKRISALIPSMFLSLRGKVTNRATSMVIERAALHQRKLTENWRLQNDHAIESMRYFDQGACPIGMVTSLADRERRWTESVRTA